MMKVSPMIAMPMLPITLCISCSTRKIGFVRKKNQPQSMASTKPLIGFSSW